MKKLSRQFYLREDVVQIARELLGKILVVPADDGERVSGMIVECEAYMGQIDRAAHSYGGRRTARNEITYGAGGFAYVFFIYGMYYQLNVVTHTIDTPHVVLIRALEPVDGIEIIRARRNVKGKTMPDKNLTSGPGKLTIAMGIDRSFNGEDLLGDRMWLEEGKKCANKEIAVGKRIGIDYAGEDAEKPWRFWVKDNPFVSKK
ncbi:MAG TPA: DNA-3-methyladenine glycosylase [Pyrinomonadaceae bacterium]|jgi:DNA-3-methyladenine glycosylase|nr:DNA-3-methyladenine glycosylase [Pyrinomonadaceae bacterium]